MLVVDTLAAMQGVIDAKEKHKINQELYNRVISAMNNISMRNEYLRDVFELNRFFQELGKVDFGDDPFEVATLLGLMGNSIESGLIVAAPQ